MAVTNALLHYQTQRRLRAAFLGGNMVAKNKIHGRRIRQSLQQLHYRCLFQQLAVRPPEQNMFQSPLKQKTGLFIL